MSSVGSIDRGWRSAELGHPRRTRYMELQDRSFGDRSSGGCDQGHLRQSPSASGGGGIAVSARPPRRRRDYSGPAQRRRIRGQSASSALSYPIGAVAGLAGRQAAPPGRANTSLIDWGNSDETDRRN